ncbi:DUF4240 domain-containing protein [Amycolatopsis sp. NPDC051903]|uniref:DUF4240 domain-containing protein n=1 Tax=Amycolatopsis sp. NPDC051903 TaxID=3363936 RepID=UPI0037971430
MTDEDLAATRFWQLIDSARTSGGSAAELLAGRPRDEIVAAQRTLDELLATSHRSTLWAAAHLVNGGCSDDGFDYFRGWLLTQGRTAFEAAVADPDSLADVAAVRAAAADGAELECEDVLYLATTAHLTATGEPLPAGGLLTRLPPLEPDFDVEDPDEVRERLPRLSELFES